MQNTLSHEVRVWSALIAKRAIQVKVTKEGVRYMHPTKGRRFVSAKRFAAHGVALNA